MSDFSLWYEKHKSQMREDYFHFLRFQSISSESVFKGEMVRCADWICSYLAASRFQAKLIETSGHPIVYAENMDAGPEKATVLIYGHYDVQPVDPLELWESDPFEPAERGGSVYARGAVDDKGQIFYAMAALRAMTDLEGLLPLNVKFCIEGEEETSSAGLSELLSSIEDQLRANYLLVVDCDSYDETTPAINLGCRGILSMDVVLSGSKTDLHSGMVGGIAYNPNRALVELLAKLYDSQGRVMVDGFYDEVVEPTEEEKRSFPPRHDPAYYTKEFGLEAFGGEEGKTLEEANIFRPVLEINGIGGGYFGPGFKTVIPSQAIAKISCRLVPNQDPEKIGRRITSFLQKHSVRGMKLHTQVHKGAFAYRSDPYSKLAVAVAEAAEEVMKKPCRKVLSGASIPIIASLSKAINAQTVGMGYGLPTDQIHAPNERFDWKRFRAGFLTVAGALQRL